MLIDRYLPAYHFKEFHAIALNGFLDGIYNKMLHSNFKPGRLIQFLLKLRGMPKDVYTIEHLSHIGFIKLDEEPGSEIVFGIVTNNAMFNECQSNVSPSDFRQNTDASSIKAVINFRLQHKSNSQHIISTETRIWCGSRLLKSQFGKYWFFIKPFSGLIRQSMLKQMKQQILQKA